MKSQAQSLRALYAPGPVRVLASPRRDLAQAKPPVARPGRRCLVCLQPRRGFVGCGADVRTSSIASKRICNAVLRPLWSGVPAHASGGSARRDDAQRTTLHPSQTRLPLQRATTPTLVDGVAPAVAGQRSAKAYRQRMRQVCLEISPKLEWPRPPDINQ